jgi:hypothetical protein
MADIAPEEVSSLVVAEAVPGLAYLDDTSPLLVAAQYSYNFHLQVVHPFLQEEDQITQKLNDLAGRTTNLIDGNKTTRSTSHATESPKLINYINQHTWMPKLLLLLLLLTRPRGGPLIWLLAPHSTSLKPF